MIGPRGVSCIYLFSSLLQGCQIPEKDFLSYNSRQMIWVAAKLSDTCHILGKLPIHLTKLCRLRVSLFYTEFGTLCWLFALDIFTSSQPLRWQCVCLHSECTRVLCRSSTSVTDSVSLWS